jgi:energy-coupling factor transport system ATP-binding protein
MVEEDVAFGLENIGVETGEIWNCVGESLRKLGIEKLRLLSPNRLSGGQKQKVAIAGIMAMQPGCIVLDEATSMLDPKGRQEVLSAMLELNRREKITVVLITHYMEEALYADQALVMEQGKIVMAGTPREIFSQEEKLEELHLDVPPVTEIANRLRRAGLPVAKGIVTKEELVQAVKRVSLLSREEKNRMQEKAERYLQREKERKLEKEKLSSESGDIKLEEKVNFMREKLPVLVLDQVCYTYKKEAENGKNAVDNVSLSIHQGEFLALLGHTGSGKSTLLQLMNGLLKATEGKIYYKGQDISDKNFSMKELRSHVGLVFQYPEYQLFETTVVKDVMFGPKNQGLSLLQAQMNTFEALKLTGIGEELFDVSPFSLSGGQKRRVAIAGVLAMKPELMILDEPAAGLDPQSKKELFDMLENIHKQTGMAVLIVSHSMEDAAEYARRILVMKHGRILFDDTPDKVFLQEEELRAAGLDIPVSTQLHNMLRKEELAGKKAVYTKEQLVEEVIKELER